jgi:hypothetical protein
VENTGGVASEFLRVEFRTEPKELQTLKGRFHRQPSPDGSGEVVQFENAQVRISRLTCAAGRTLPVAASVTEPALLIELEPQPGTHTWIEEAARDTLAAAGKSVEWLRFDFKTRPASPRTEAGALP